MSHKYLKVLLPVEDDGLCLDFSVLDVHLVSGQNDGNVFANSNQIAMPVRNVLVCHARCDVEHDDGTLSLNIIAISQTTELFLASSVPYIKCNWAEICGECQWMDFDTESG